VLVNDLTLILVAGITAGGAVWAASITRKVREVHILVNNQLDAVMNKNVDLTAQLKQAREDPPDRG
jgi:ketopantoate reductase